VRGFGQRPLPGRLQIPSRPSPGEYKPITKDNAPAFRPNR
jgi:hypothetical protein